MKPSLSEVFFYQNLQFDYFLKVFGKRTFKQILSEGLYKILFNVSISFMHVNLLLYLVLFTEFVHISLTQGFEGLTQIV